MSSLRDNQKPDTAPLYTRANPPGRAALAYRGARYLDAVRRMLDRLPNQEVACAGPELPAPLAALNRDLHDDWAIALIHAWAVVTDVLSFYQERITNEGYLRTATEYRSVLELARTLGCELKPGLAASTYLAFTVLTVKDEPPRQVLIPKGAAIQSTPAQDQLPQIFETSADFLARAEWNAIRPAMALVAPPRPFASSVALLRLAGVDAGLRRGDALLIVDADPPPEATARPWLLATLTTVAADPQRGYTTVGWDSPTSAAFRSPVVFALAPPAGLLTYPQSAIYFADRALPDWAPSAIGLPKATVRALAANAAGKLFAGTEKDLFSSLDQGVSWQPSQLALVQKDVYALAIDADGNTYAGTKDGGIFLSKDQGANWLAMSDSSLPPPPAPRIKLPGPAAGPLPKTVVRALATYDSTLAAATDDGVLRSTDCGKTWAPANADIPKADPKTGLTPVVAWSLAVARRGSTSELFAGTDAGVFHIQSQASTLAVSAVIPAVAIAGGWLLKDVGKGITPLDKLIQAGKDLLSGAGKLLSSAIDAIANLTEWLKPLGDLKSSVAGLAKQIAGWLAARATDLAGLITGLPLVGPLIARYFAPALNVLILTALVAAALLAARKLANRYYGARATFSLAQPVYALVAAKSGQLFAATKQGVFRSNDGDEQQGSRLQQIWRSMLKAVQGDLARRWSPASAGLTSLDVRALALDDAGALLAGTQDGLIFRLPDKADTWAPVGAGPTLKSVLAIWAAIDGYYAAGAPIDRADEAAWPRNAIAQRQLDLDRLYPAIDAGQSIVLRQAGVPAALYRAVAVMPVDGPAVARPGQFTRVTLDTADRLADFDRRGVAVLAQGAPIALYDDSPIQGKLVAFDTFVPGIEIGHTLIVSGKRIRARLALHVAQGSVRLRSPDGLLSPVLQPGELVQVLAMPVIGADGMASWKLCSRDGIVGSVRVPADALIWEPANPDDELVSELARVDLVGHSAIETTVTLHEPLANLYDRSTVVVYGNVVHATHGQTVANEQLGSSDSMSNNQQFLLKQPPLTYLPAASSTGSASTLNVTVNGVRWEEVPFLHQRARNQRVYMLRQDAASGPPIVPDDKPSGAVRRAGALARVPRYPSLAVIFGDGVYGAGLPTGTWKIVANYRSGLGRAGNVASRSLNVLQTAIRGVKGVTNPIAASGGIDPQTMDDARQQAPQTVRAMRRIVSFTDYEDFAREFPGIGKVHAELLGHGRGRFVHLTVGDADGNPIGKDSDLYAKLLQNITSYRAAPVPAVAIDSFEPRYFNLRARVLLDPDQLARRDAIDADIRQALSDTFSYRRREFAQGVAEAEVVNVIQQVGGVVAVELIWLYLHDEPPALNSFLEAMPVRLNGSQVAPAEMVLVNTTSKDGISLELYDD